MRLKAVHEITSDLDESSRALLHIALAKESDTGVREAMQTGLTLMELDSPDPGTRLTAIESLKSSLNPAVRNRLTALLHDEAQDRQVHTAAQRALSAIEFQLQIHGLIETIFFGLSLGSVLVLADPGGIPGRGPRRDCD